MLYEGDFDIDMSCQLGAGQCHTSLQCTCVAEWKQFPEVRFNHPVDRPPICVEAVTAAD